MNADVLFNKMLIDYDLPNIILFISSGLSAVRITISIKEKYTQLDPYPHNMCAPPPNHPISAYIPLRHTSVARH